MRILLVHAPALGPATWRWVAAALVAGGHEVAVPDLRPAAVAGSPADAVAAAVAARPDAEVVVGHSGAGRLLPAVAAGCTTGPVVVWVDAGLPSDRDPFVARLRTLAVDGVLPPWSARFGADLLATQVPDAERRAVVAAEQPRMALAFATAGAPVAPLPDRAAYLQLSEAYGDDAAAADDRGWPTAALPSTHLGIVTRPDDVAAALVDLAGRAIAGPPGPEG